MSDQALEQQVIETIPGCTEQLAIEVCGSLEFGLKRELDEAECKQVFNVVEQVLSFGVQPYLSGARILPTTDSQPGTGATQSSNLQR
jgi:hypothetical protein